MTRGNATPTRSPAPVATGHPKIQARQLERSAIVYVRQSSPQQVLHHRESTDLQYQLVDRAKALGWPAERVTLIDDDLGRSGRSMEGRDGFRRLLAEVAVDRVGLVLGIDMSRLARSCKDWYHLLELCARYGTLLADQDGLYDPREFNDRLLLGLKGTMSEAELYVLHQRMRQGILNKARRGELFSHPPIGYVRDPAVGVALDPDEQVRHTVGVVFELFDELGSINDVTRYLRREGIRLGVRPHCGPDRGRLVWREACRGTVRNLLRHPMYAGAYAYGRCQTAENPTGGRDQRWEADPEQWRVLIKDRLPAYITWERFEANCRRLADNQARETRPGVPRDGAALLGGLLRCAGCGGRMSARYGGPKREFRYQCVGTHIQYPGRGCASISGPAVDAVVAADVLRALQPAALELSCQAAEAARHEQQRLHRHWHQRLERVAFDVDLARRRYEAVDPENRLVARALEVHWETALQRQQTEQQAYDAFVKDRPEALSAEEQAAVLALAETIPAVWAAETTRPSERQEIVRLLIEQVRLTVRHGSARFEVAIAWKGGFETCHSGCRRIHRIEQMDAYEAVLARAAELRRGRNSDRKIAAVLNTEGHRPALGRCGFTKDIVNRLLAPSAVPTEPKRRTSYADALGPDEWWLADLAAEVGIRYVSLHAWIRRGWVRARKVSSAAGMQAVWADTQELRRLRQLRDHRQAHPYRPPPADLTISLQRSPAEIASRS
jgi:DNA invertase Pin-like site-specific DNA recombinase